MKQKQDRLGVAGFFGILLIVLVSWPAWAFAAKGPALTMVDGPDPISTVTPPEVLSWWDVICAFDPHGWSPVCPRPVHDPVLPRPQDDPVPCPPPPTDSCDPNNASCS